MENKISKENILAAIDVLEKSDIEWLHTEIMSHAFGSTTLIVGGFIVTKEVGKKISISLLGFPLEEVLGDSDLIPELARRLDAVHHERIARMSKLRLKRAESKASEYLERKLGVANPTPPKASFIKRLFKFKKPD